MAWHERPYRPYETGVIIESQFLSLPLYESIDEVVKSGTSCSQLRSARHGARVGNFLQRTVDTAIVQLYGSSSSHSSSILKIRSAGFMVLRIMFIEQGGTRTGFRDSRGNTPTHSRMTPTGSPEGWKWVLWRRILVSQSAAWLKPA
jgi:hypothetical protein